MAASTSSAATCRAATSRCCAPRIATTSTKRLAIAFRTPEGWSAPQDLGDAVNGGKESMGAQLGPDHRTLYFYSDRRAAGAQANAVWNNGHDHIWQLSLAPWLDAHAGRGP